MHPTPVVRPAVTIEATAMSVMLSIACPVCGSLLSQVVAAGSGAGLRVRVAAAMYTAARMLKM